MENEKALFRMPHSALHNGGPGYALRMSVLNLGRYPPARLRHLAQLQEECATKRFVCG